MTEGNIAGADRKNSYYCAHFPDILKTYQRETALFKLSRNMNRKQLKIRKNDVTLQWFHFVMAS